MAEVQHNIRCNYSTCFSGPEVYEQFIKAVKKQWTSCLNCVPRIQNKLLQGLTWETITQMNNYSIFHNLNKILSMKKLFWLGGN